MTVVGHARITLIKRFVSVMSLTTYIVPVKIGFFVSCPEVPQDSYSLS